MRGLPVGNTAMSQQTISFEPPRGMRDFYPAEMAWRNRLPINDYLVKIIGEYMEAHHEWKETIDILNK